MESSASSARSASRSSSHRGIGHRPRRACKTGIERRKAASVSTRGGSAQKGKKGGVVGFSMGGGGGKREEKGEIGSHVASGASRLLSAPRSEGSASTADAYFRSLEDDGPLCSSSTADAYICGLEDGGPSSSSSKFSAGGRVPACINDLEGSGSSKSRAMADLIDSTALTGQTASDWQEKIYHKVNPIQRYTSHENQVLLPDLQDYVSSMQSTTISSMQGFLTLSENIGDTDTQLSTPSLLQSSSNMDFSQDKSLALSQQGKIGSLQQSNVTLCPTATIVSSQIIPENISTFQQSTSAFQHQHLREADQQDHRMLQHQLHQPIQRHKRLKLQPQKSAQLHVYQMLQHHQMNEMNCFDVAEVSDSNTRLFQSHFAVGQGQTYRGQQPKQESPHPPVSQNITSLPFIVPFQSNPLAESPLHRNHEKPEYSTSLSKVGDIGRHQVPGVLAQGQSLIISPCISPSQMHDENDGSQASESSVFLGESDATEQPIERLVKAVKLLPSGVLGSALRDIAFVVSTIDMIPELAPGIGVHGVVEDLTGATKLQLQARDILSRIE